MRLAGTPLRDYSLAAALLALAFAYTLMAGRFGAASRAVPQIVGGATVLLCLLDIGSRSDTPAGRLVARWLNPAGGTAKGASRRGRQGAALAALAGTVLAMALIGLPAAVAGFCLVAFRRGAGLGWIRSAVASLIVAGLIWALFREALGLDLFPGLLFGGSWG